MKCRHDKSVIWVPIQTAQGGALACKCLQCGEITDVMHDDEPVYWKDPLPEDEPDTLGDTPWNRS